MNFSPITPRAMRHGHVKARCQRITRAVIRANLCGVGVVTRLSERIGECIGSALGSELFWLCVMFGLIAIAFS